jgi:FAD/FMN-containing dehydrogenase
LTLSRILLAAAVAALTPIAAYAALLFYVWITDGPAPLPDPDAGAGDFSRLSHASRATVIHPPPDPSLATAELQELVRKASTDGKKITIAGAKHSMGGHTLLDDSLCIDMRCEAFRTVGDVTKRGDTGIVRVGAGATWHELLTVLDRTGWSVAVMQSNDDFTIGGSISVNCHGWDAHSGPLDATIESFRILLADGTVRDCRRDKADDRELFRAVCGGYGLLGILLDVDLRVVPNRLYRAQEFSANAETYSRQFNLAVPPSDTNIGLDYGRISVAPGPWFLHDARIIRFVETENPGASVTNTVAANGGHFTPAAWEIGVAREAFRASAISDFAKLGRWAIERFHGQTHQVVSRNGILQTPSDWFANRDPAFTEVLHEYFVPPEQLSEFLGRIRPILRRRDINLLNITVRDVQRDEDSLLAYAPREVFGLVMLFRYHSDVTDDEKMRQVTKQLIDAALECGGTYYLPYRPHATREQFQRAYPQRSEFYAVKQKYDPQDIFENTFYLSFIKP